MKQTFFFVLTLTTLVYSAGAQTADTLIYAEGKIFSAATKEPISARIVYESVPYASKVGSLTGTSYTFPLQDNERYSIVVEANGFSPSKYLLDPKTANANRRVIQDIELGLPQTVSAAVDNTHKVGAELRLDNLIFKTGEAVIAPQSYPELDQLVAKLSENPKMVIQLEGHTDIIGDPKKNMKLSEQRVEAVRNYLMSKGVHKNNVKTKAFGGTMPLSTANTEEAHKLNRRVVVRILQN